jgi:hypothetical protein
MAMQRMTCACRKPALMQSKPTSSTPELTLRD